MNKKRILIALLVFLVCGGTIQAQADVSVRGYYRKDGTYVRPHMRSDPDGNFNNNWSTKGNINPYTGEEGTKTSPSDSGLYDSSNDSYNNSDSSYSDDTYYNDDTNYTEDSSSGQEYGENGYIYDTDSVDNEDAMTAMDTVYKYFDKLNEKKYKDAYNLWSSKWKKKHSYKKFKKGYKGVTHEITTVSIDSSDGNKVIVEGDLATKEKGEEHSYSFTYKVKVSESGKGKITKGMLVKSY
ncbi:NTF2-like N-terminal transpeptidase domain-containing protein [Priestia megaterium]